MFITHIVVNDFECMWKIQDEKFHEFLTYNIICGYIICNDGNGYGLLEHPISYFGVHVLQ